MNTFTINDFQNQTDEQLLNTIQHTVSNIPSKSRKGWVVQFLHENDCSASTSLKILQLLSATFPELLRRSKIWMIPVQKILETPNEVSNVSLTKYSLLIEKLSLLLHQQEDTIFTSLLTNDTITQKTMLFEIMHRSAPHTSLYCLIQKWCVLLYPSKEDSFQLCDYYAKHIESYRVQHPKCTKMWDNHAHLFDPSNGFTIIDGANWIYKNGKRTKNIIQRLRSLEQFVEQHMHTSSVILVLSYTTTQLVVPLLSESFRTRFNQILVKTQKGMHDDHLWIVITLSCMQKHYQKTWFLSNDKLSDHIANELDECLRRRLNTCRMVIY